MSRQYIKDLTEKPIPYSIGNKAENLWKLSNLGAKIPKTYCCTWDAHADFQQHGELVLDQLRNEIIEVLDLDSAYAIRSSTNLEDDQNYSYAGQFASILDVRGLDAIVAAVQEVWNSSQVEGVQSYQARVKSEQTSPRMAIILQEMVPPVLSGVVFSKNPLTGLDETIIEAVEGPGTTLVQEGATPFRWVEKWGQWLESPAEQESYSDLVIQIVEETKRIVEAYGQDLDLEWVYDGDQLYWVQMREITTLEDIKIYSNKISKEFLPGMIKPLVWSVNVPLVNSAWIKLITEVIGDNDLEAKSLAHSFFYRAYFNMTAFGKIFDRLGMRRQSLEINLGIVEPPENRPAFRLTVNMVKLLPRLLKFLFDKWQFSRPIEKSFPEIEAEFQQIAQEQTQNLNQGELLEKIDSLYQLAQEAAYFNIVVPLLMNAYSGATRRQLGHYDVDFEQFDLTAGLKSLDDYAPDTNLERLSLEFSSLAPDLQEAIRKSDYESFQQISGIEPFQIHVSQFIAQFGHLSDSGNDFSVRPWREDPELIFSLITTYQTSKKEKRLKVGYEDLTLKGPRGWLTSLFYHRARQYRYFRERVSSTYTFGYGLFRNYYLALGEHFVRSGTLADKNDIFYLYDEEIRQFIAGQISKKEIGENVSKRRLEMEEYRNVELPEIIYGDQPPPSVTASAEKMHGTPTSRGIYTGPTRIVRGLQDFKKVNVGDVVVIPYSDVGWTPMFSKAGAIIAESGGILSHSSIIAREYNIPAVVSVANAFTIEEKTIVTVDGYLGDIFIHERKEEDE